MRKSEIFSVVLLLGGLFSPLATLGHSRSLYAAAKIADAQSAPQRPSPSETPMPGLPKSERVEQPRGKTEQYTLSEDRYEKAVAYSRAAYTLYFVSYLLSFAVLILLLRLKLSK
jgi:hypothetical protein